MQDFYKKLSVILEVDEVVCDAEVVDYENWDSLGVLAILAMIDSTYKVTVSSDELKLVRKVGDLEEIVKAKISK